MTARRSDVVGDQGTAEKDSPSSAAGAPTARSSTAQAVNGRRVVLRGLVATSVLGMSGVLAACGSDDEPTVDAGGQSATTPTADEATPTAAETPTEGDSGAAALTPTADVPEGGGVILADIVVTQPAAGDFKAFSNVCTHMRCKVTSVAEGTINCACHGSRFNIETGAVENGPATAPLEEVAVAVEGDSVVRA